MTLHFVVFILICNKKQYALKLHKKRVKFLFYMSNCILIIIMVKLLCVKNTFDFQKGEIL